MQSPTNTSFRTRIEYENLIGPLPQIQVVEVRVHSKQSLKCTQQKTMTSVTQVHLEDHLDVALHYARTKVTSLLHRLLILNMYANYGIIHTSLNPISQPGSLCPLPDAGSARRRRIQAACQISCPQVGGHPEFSIVCCPGRG